MKDIQPLLFYKSCPRLSIFSNEADVWTKGTKSYYAMTTNLLGPDTIQLKIKKDDILTTSIQTHKLMYFANVCLLMSII